MYRQKNEQTRRAHQTVFGEQIQIIVVGSYWIELHSLAAELPAVVQISSATRPDDGLQLPLLDCRLPQINPHILSVKRVAGPGTQKIVFLKEEDSSDDG